MDAVVAFSVFFPLLLFAAWTVAHHIATFGGVPWRVLSLAAAVAALPAALLASWVSGCLARSFAAAVEEVSQPSGLNGALPTVVFVLAAVLLLLIPGYGLRFGIAVIATVIMYWVTGRRQSDTSLAGAASADVPFFSRHAAWILLFCAAATVTVVLGFHRPDLDDSSFVQIASQTLRFPELVPLTFDASLGTVMEPFRFAPYRIVSYETLAALLTGWTGFDLLTVYYLLLPGLTAALSIGVAYIFARWFLPRGLAVIAVAVFILLVLAWGETHIAYGNRVFVRLFQGKGLLIALTTPLSIIAGLMFFRRPSLMNWSLLALVNVAAVGVSSTGLLCVFMTATLVVVVAFFLERNIRVFFFGMVLACGATLLYPAALGLWLKSAGGNVSMSGLGTPLPINASLGLGMREALAFALLVLGVGSFGASGRSYRLLALGGLVIVFNPWFSELLVRVTSRSMSWRLAWAMPLPLLMAVAVSASMASVFSRRGRLKKRSWYGISAAIIALLLFLVSAPWTLARANRVTWRFPSPKIPAEYEVVKEISAVLESRAKTGTVLASKKIAAWLPLLAPDIKVVMPGHMYWMMFRSVLPPPDFANRMALVAAINGRLGRDWRLAVLVNRYGVTTLVLPQGSNADRVIIDSLGIYMEVGAEEIAVVKGYKIVALRYRPQFSQ